MGAKKPTVEYPQKLRRTIGDSSLWYSSSLNSFTGSSSTALMPSLLKYDARSASAAYVPRWEATPLEGWRVNPRTWHSYTTRSLMSMPGGVSPSQSNGISLTLGTGDARAGQQFPSAGTTPYSSAFVPRFPHTICVALGSITTRLGSHRAPREFRRLAVGTGAPVAGSVVVCGVDGAAAAATASETGRFGDAAVVGKISSFVGPTIRHAYSSPGARLSSRTCHTDPVRCDAASSSNSATGRPPLMLFCLSVSLVKRRSETLLTWLCACTAKLTALASTCAPNGVDVPGVGVPHTPSTADRVDVFGVGERAYMSFSLVDAPVTTVDGSAGDVVCVYPAPAPAPAASPAGPTHNTYCVLLLL
mmetsp:Transcript_2966/g.8086  ORF Transcript_2966/g.8086 Transcript_2966/m.8086 type:complete len:360 (-) Transcript_2966:449-1528(-)